MYRRESTRTNTYSGDSFPLSFNHDGVYLHRSFWSGTKSRGLFALIGAALLLGGIESPAVGSSAAQRSAAPDLSRAVVSVDGGMCSHDEQGTGFEISPGVIATAAHVVGDRRHPIVESRAGYLPSRLVYYESVLDLAVLKTPVSLGTPLRIQSSVLRIGTRAEIVGYPEAGPPSVIKARIAAVLRQAIVRLSDGHLVRRIIYELRARVLPGISGAPLIGPHGKVAGLVESRSATNTGVAFALAIADLRGELTASQNDPGATPPTTMCTTYRRGKQATRRVIGPAR